ncbi:MAG: hypothetical protein QGD90_03575 [Candidatus Hydrogenedentes bacterium]|nr:hypothetical protein [Candidatus Hydrogenedentota bacterium]
MSRIRAFLRAKHLRIVGAIVLVAFGALCVLDSGRVADLTFYTALNDHAIALLDDTLERDMATFLLITAVKASLAMIEGSSVGVGFELQVGDIVQPAYDYVDFFWRAFLYAFMVLGFYKLLLETELLFLGIVLIGIGFVLSGVALAATVPRLDLRLWSRRCILLGILVAYVAPLSLLLTDVLSQRYTTSLKDKHYDAINAFNVQLERSAIEFLQLKEKISILQPSRSFDEIQSGMLRIVNRIGEAFRLSLLAFLYYVLIILFELLVFPLLSAVILYKFTLFAVGRVLQTQPPQPAAPAPAPEPTG